MIAMRHRTQALLAFALCFAQAAGKGFEDEMYHAALKSPHMEKLNRNNLDDFLLNPREAYLLVLFHVGTCHICKEALPTLDGLAQEWSEKDIPIAVGHVESGDAQEYWRRRFGFRGFPHLSLWHRGEDFADNATSLQNLRLDDTRKPLTLRITDSTTQLLDAARKAGMATVNDEQRALGLGREADLVEVAFDDFTAKLRVMGGSKKALWYPMEALAYPDGSPVMAVRRPPKHVGYRPTSWKKEGIKDFAERMMRPTITTLQSTGQDASTQMTLDMAKEKLVALVLCANKLEDSAGFEPLAKAWQDKHRAYFAKSRKACPVDADEWPVVLAYSPAHQQWHPRGKPRPAAAVAGPGIAGSSDADVLSSWFDKHCFPGLWAIEYENFPQFIHGGRTAAIVAIDDSSDSDNKKVHRKILDVAKPATGHKESLHVFSYKDNSTYWGIVSGHLNGLDAFGIYTLELPRVVVFEGADTWKEDVDELSIWDLEAGLRKLPQLVSYGRGVRGFLLTNLYKPWTNWNRASTKIGGAPLRIGLNVIFVVGGLCCAWSVGKACMSIVTSLFGEEDTAAEHKKAD